MRITAEDTLALVIDYQEKLVPVINNKEDLVESTAKLIKGLHILNIPVITTQQYTKGLGMTIEVVQENFETPFIYQEKIHFSCAEEESVLEVIKSQNKNNIIICGIEAHICVLQTVVDLIELGYQVIVVEDCVSARKMEDKNVAMKRMIQEGAILTTYESILFEMTRKAGSEQFKAISRLIK